MDERFPIEDFQSTRLYRAEEGNIFGNEFDIEKKCSRPTEQPGLRQAGGEQYSGGEHADEEKLRRASAEGSGAVLP